MVPFYPGDSAGQLRTAAVVDGDKQAGPWPVVFIIDKGWIIFVFQRDRFPFVFAVFYGPGESLADASVFSVSWDRSVILTMGDWYRS